MAAIRAWLRDGGYVWLMLDCVDFDGIERLFSGPAFHEVALKLDRPVGPVLDSLAARGILGGYDLGADFPEFGNALLVCATETKTEADVGAYVDAMRDIFSAAPA